MSQFRTTLWTRLHAAGAGDESALDAFVRRYRPPLVSFLSRRGLSPSAAEDAAQDVFLRLLRRDLLLQADASKGRFRSYLLGIALRVLSEQRRRDRAEKRGGGWDQVPLESVAPASREAEAEFEACWLQELMRRALAAVESGSPSLHEMLTYAAQGLGPSEIAAQTGRSPGAVRVALHRARKRLADELKQEVARYCSSEEEFAAEMQAFSRFLGES